VLRSREAYSLNQPSEPSFGYSYSHEAASDGNKLSSDILMNLRVGLLFVQSSFEFPRLMKRKSHATVVALNFLFLKQY